MVAEKSVYILGVQKFLVLSNFLVGTSNTLPYESQVFDCHVDVILEMRPKPCIGAPS